MKRLFNRVFSSPSEPEASLSFPPLPSALSLDDIKQRSIVGYIARRIAQRLHHENADSLFYLAYSKGSFESPVRGVDPDFPIFLADLMFNWIQQGEEIGTKIKELNLSTQLETVFMDTYRELRESLIREIPVLIPREEKAAETEPIDMEMRDTELTERKEWKIYRDVMFAVTQRKFLLISKQEMDRYKFGQILCEGEIKVRSDIPKCRDMAKEALQQLGFDLSTVMGWMLLISEAITNILKHAEEGRMILVEEDGSVRVIVEDKGPGFSLEDLPNTTLMAGYSTKKSLGQGFTLMMKMTEQVLLYTSKKGSTIILILVNREGERSHGIKT